MKQIQKYSDSGFITLPTALMLFSLSLMLASVTALVLSSSRKTESYRRYLLEKKELEKFIDCLVSDFQNLTKDENDRETAENYIKFLDKYAEFDIKVDDVSTGINEKILSKEFLRERNIANLLSVKGDDVKSSYGWINPSFAESSFVRSVLDEHKKKNTDDLFPIFSHCSYFNVFKMSDDFIRAVLEHFNITDTDSKVRKMREAINSREILTSEKIAEILSVRENHNVLDFIGVKTVFWKVSFKKNGEKTELIIAAVPYKKEKVRKIEKYIIVERRSE